MDTSDIRTDRPSHAADTGSTVGTVVAPGEAAAWEAAPCPALVVDGSGTVRRANEAARRLLPDATPGTPLHRAAPGWLVTAHTRVGPRVATHGPVADRHLTAHPTPGADGDIVWWLVDDTDRRHAEEALRRERRRTAFMTEASEALLASLNLERCSEVTAQLAARHLADAAVVVAPPTGRRLPVTYCDPGGDVTHGLVRADPDQVPGLGEALSGFPPVPSRWIDPASAPAWLLPPGFDGEAASLVITPLPGHGVPAGALVLLRRAGRGVFTEGEEETARLFAARAGVAISAARLYAEQAGTTATLMEELLPPRLRQTHGVELAGGYRAARAGERVGGDFYDVYRAPNAERESLVVLGDVCGKGLEAAVLTGKVRNALQTLAPLSVGHQQILGLLNEALLDSRHTRFVTLVLASVRREAGRVRLRLTSAGHPPPLLVRADGTVTEAETQGSLIGVLPEVRSTTAVTHLAPGETALLFTDGITEARGGPLGDELFGDARLREALGQCAGMPAEAVVERVQMLASQWIGDRGHDDMAVVAITAPRHAHLSAVDGHTPGRYTA
ncbi:PP2C family protein-serine/threonine phosphatase [Streptomyces avicenniae]|uniref:PP2C family protein-serine/threonine phosphatase n=1 Tax=Streptomyces avicenniae TaxID=500153 RepID=UPI000A581AED